MTINRPRTNIGKRWRRSRPWLQAAGVLSAAAVLSLSTRSAIGQAPAAGQLTAQATTQIAALEADKAQRTPAQQKIGSRLLRAGRILRGEPVAAGVTTLRQTVAVSADGRVSVDIDATVSPDVLGAIEAAGGTIDSSFAEYHAIRAEIPLDRLETIAALPDVRSIRPADQAMTNQRPGSREGAGNDPPLTNKDNTSQGDTAHRTALIRSIFGFTGAGVGIGVLSDGVNTLAARQASGDLPAVTVLGGQAGSGDEGTAMLEIVTDLAPGSPLFFATGFSGQAQFATNIQNLCAAGARVIVDDVTYFAEPAFQDGTVAQGVNTAVGNGCFYFSSAGNSGNLNDGQSGVWEGDFVAAAANPPGVVGTAHDFGGASNSRLITVDSPSFFTLQWSDAMGASSNDYDLYLFDNGLTTVLDVSNDTQSGTQNPFEIIDSQGFNDTNTRLVIVRKSGVARYLHLNTNRGRLSGGTAGQTFSHNAAANAFTVAAVNVATASGGAFVGGGTNPVETYSSDGPRRIFYNAAGTAITPGNFLATGGTLLQKPDLAAADCVVTATPGFNPFCGTSAAAPHAAAIAALMLQAAGGPTSLTLAQMRAAISARSLDIEAVGVDRDSGSGIMDAIGVVPRVHPPFTDTLVSGTTVIKAVHFSELKSRINAQRVRCGLGQAPFFAITPGVTIVTESHVTQFRTALNEAYTACSLAPPSYTDPSLAGVMIKAVHIDELRAAVVALE